MQKECIVLITGCSTGLGRELSEFLSAGGYTVIATARNVKAISDLQVSLKLTLDVTQKASIDAAVSEAISRFHRIDILVNNAGYAIRGALEEIPGENIEKMFAVNFFGVHNMIKAVLPEMRKNRSGKIINIGSISGRFTQPVNGAYCASKYAVEALTDALRLELCNQGIQATVIEPGTVKTSFFQKSIQNSSELINNPASCYAGLYTAYAAFMQAQKPADSRSVVRSINRIIAEKHLKPRYQVAIPFKSNLLALLSDPLKEYLLKKALNIA